jgi:hypothetical protein
MSNFFDTFLLRRFSGAKSAYIEFADTTVASICASTWGDGTGLTYARAKSITTLGTAFKGNTSIVSFDELQYFTGLTTIDNYAFQDCTALAQVTLPPTLSVVGQYAFNGCTSLATVNYYGTGTFSMNARAFQKCPLTTFPTKALSSMVGDYGLHGNKLAVIEFSSSFTAFGYGACIRGGQAPQTVIIHATTPPTSGGRPFYYDRGGGSFYINPSVRIYVPYSADHSILAAYQAASGWSEFANYMYEYHEVPAAYRRLTGIVFDGNVYYETNFKLTGADRVSVDFSITKACNVFGCYTSAEASNNYSLYATTTSGGKYMRYDGGTYNSYLSTNTRYTATIKPTGTEGLRTNSSWTAATFTADNNMLIGTTATNATSSKFSGTLYGNVDVAGRTSLIPVERISDGAIGYYDPIADAFLANQGTGTPVKLGYA